MFTISDSVEQKICIKFYLRNVLAFGEDLVLKNRRITIGTSLILFIGFYWVNIILKDLLWLMLFFFGKKASLLLIMIFLTSRCLEMHHYWKLDLDILLRRVATRKQSIKSECRAKTLKNQGHIAYSLIIAYRPNWLQVIMSRIKSNLFNIKYENEDLTFLSVSILHKANKLKKIGYKPV